MNSRLFDSYRIRDTEFRNRLWVSPMCQYSALHGVPQEWHRVHYGALARGGAGLLTVEATAVAPEGRISPEDTGIWNDLQRDEWRSIVDTAHRLGGLIGIQLAHAGRKASTWRPWEPHRGTVPIAEGGWPTVAPSAIAFEGLEAPRALDAEGIAGVIEAFRTAARRAVEAGFDVVEIHSAHGYLLHEFLSPLSNERDDEWGGSLENRARLLLEIVRAVRVEIGELPLLVRLSATDWAPGGWDVDDTVTVAGWAREAGADLFDISSGGLVHHQRIELGPGYQVPFAEAVTRAGLPASAVGLITSAAQADAVIAEGRAEVVTVGRAFLRDPHFALRAAHELGVELDYWPPQYLRARWR